MKFIKSIILTFGVLVATSCTLDLTEDPNAVQPKEILPSLQLNSMQRNLAVFFQGASTFGMQMTRLQNAGDAIYLTTVTPESFDGMWSTAYASILSDADQLIALADEKGFARHAGIARIIQAYILITLVDYFGDVPFTQAFAGAGNFNPEVDLMTDLYPLAITILDRAKLDLRTPATTAVPAGYFNSAFAPAINDFYYNNNYTSWVRLANTLKLKIYLNTGNVAQINALIADVSASGNLITAANESFIWRYGTNTADPDARHPRFIANYPAGGGNYMSNWLIWHMLYGYNATSGVAAVGIGDPRMRFYFYRQTLANSSDPNEIRCITEASPAHYPKSTGSAIITNPTAGMPPMGVGVGHPTTTPAHVAWSRTFCYPSGIGYWGRDHVDPQGIPPDGLLRTAWGAYPSGGHFDANTNTGVTTLPFVGQVGMFGAGFQPIMMRSFVNFMRAEATLLMGATGSAVALYQAGIEQSFDDVRTWATTGTYGTTAVAASPNQAAGINAFYPAANYTTDRNNYVTAAVAAFNAGPLTGSMNYVAREYWIASFGNGVEAYNLYRRTGQPSGMQPVIHPAPGPFPRSFWYPAVSANLNASIVQKANLAGKVFWNTNSTNLDF